MTLERPKKVMLSDSCLRPCGVPSKNIGKNRSEKTTYNYNIFHALLFTSDVLELSLIYSPYQKVRSVVFIVCPSTFQWPLRGFLSF